MKLKNFSLFRENNYREKKWFQKEKKWWPTLLNLVSLRGYRNRVNLLLDDFCRVESIKIKKHTKNLTWRFLKTMYKSVKTEIGPKGAFCLLSYFSFLLLIFIFSSSLFFLESSISSFYPKSLNQYPFGHWLNSGLHR